jgi:uncharacterized membrane protein required for colicin V production
MISLFVLFWVMVVLFAIIGMMRGWSKEVIAMAGLILSLFTINTFGATLVNLLGGVRNELEVGGFDAAMRQQFYVLGTMHILIGFFSYQGVALMRGRLSGREKFQERLLGLIFGAINGYLIVATLWSLLEYQVSPGEWIRLTANLPYAFDPHLTRPAVDTPAAELLLTHLPLPWLNPLLPILLIAVFLFVIVVVI